MYWSASTVNSQQSTINNQQSETASHPFWHFCGYIARIIRHPSKTNGMSCNQVLGDLLTYHWSGSQVMNPLGNKPQLIPIINQWSSFSPPPQYILLYQTEAPATLESSQMNKHVFCITFTIRVCNITVPVIVTVAITIPIPLSQKKPMKMTMTARMMKNLVHSHVLVQDVAWWLTSTLSACICYLHIWSIIHPLVSQVILTWLRIDLRSEIPTI